MEMIRNADTTLSKTESDQIYNCLQSLKGSGKSITTARQYMSPLLPKKGYSLCRLLYQKFCSVDSFASKLVVLYLINDIVATNHKSYPGFAECVKSYVEVMMSEIRLCQPCSIDKLQRLISLWSDHHLFPPSSIQRFHNAIHGINPNRPFAPVAAKQTESQEPPPPKPDLLSAAKTETAPLITRNWPSAGLVSEVYEDHRRLGVKPYTPVDYREVRNLHSDPHLFESDVDKLINDYNDGLLFSSLREESRVYGEEIVGQGELVFPEEEKHRSNKRSRSPFEARSRSRSSDYSYSSSSRSRSYSSHSSHSRSSYSSSERRSRSRY